MSLPSAPSATLRSQKLKKSQSLTKPTFSQSPLKQINESSRRKSETFSGKSSTANWKSFAEEKGVGKRNHKESSGFEKQQSIENKIPHVLLQPASYKSVPVKEMSFQGPFQLVELNKEKDHCPDCQQEPNKSLVFTNGVKLDPLQSEPEHSLRALRSSQLGLLHQGAVGGNFSGSSLKASAKKEVKQATAPLEGVHLTLDRFQAKLEEDPRHSDSRQLKKSISVPSSASTSFQSAPYRSADWRNLTSTPEGKPGKE